MTHRELKNAIFSFVSDYFAAATVIWGRNTAVNPRNPMITLHMGNVSRTYVPMTHAVNGVPTHIYPSATTVQVDLFTKGAELVETPDVTAAREDTAVDDLVMFVNYINSLHGQEWCVKNDVTILANQVHNLTDVINDTSWDYRAMVELEVRFMQSAVGFAATMWEGGMPYYSNAQPQFDEDGYALDKNGDRLYDGEGSPIRLPLDDGGVPILPDVEPTTSGGGSQELADQSTGWFEQVEITEEENQRGT
jgi:hypothetical protein